MNDQTIKRFFSAPRALRLYGVRRGAMMLLTTLLLTMTAQTAWATTTSTITVGGTDYTLFTGFTATNGTVTGTYGYAKLVDGNMSTDWSAEKGKNFAGGTAAPAFVEFHADMPFIPKGYVLTCSEPQSGFWKPVEWALKAKLNEGDAWTTIHSSTTTLGSGKTFNIDCTNTGNNPYQYFRFEVYEVGNTNIVDLDELQFYGNESFTYTHLTTRDATCTEIGIKQECYQRNDGKYFSDANGTNELSASDVEIPMLSHTGVHHEASDNNIEYWQCSACGKYFSDSGCTTEITEVQTLSLKYLDINGTLMTLASNENVTKVTSSLKEWNDGWYAVCDDVTIADRISVSGTVNLLLCNGATLTANCGIGVGGDASFNIYAQSAVESTMGALVANSVGYNAAIGGGNGGNFGAIVINGGNITATSNKYSISAGIGGSSNSNSGSITINGGIINARAGGGSQAAGIGGGSYGYVSSITLNGGDISAYGDPFEGYGGAGIGTGRTVEGGTMTITISNGVKRIIATKGNESDCIGKGFSTTTSVSIIFKNGESEVTGDAKNAVFYDSGEGSSRTIRSKVQNHTVMISDDIKANVTANTEYAFTGETVTLTLDTSVSSISVNNGAVSLEDAGDRKKSFTMPDENVTVTANLSAVYSFNLPEGMEIISTTNAADGNGKYIEGTVITFKAMFPYTVSNVMNGSTALTADNNGNYSVTVGDANITVTATVQHNSNIDLSEAPYDFTSIDGDVLTGSTNYTVMIANNAKITLSNATVSGGIVCSGTAEITLVGTNSVTGLFKYINQAYRITAGIQIGGSGTTLTVKGEGSLTATGGHGSAGIGLNSSEVEGQIGGNIIIESGTITAQGGKYGAGIGTGWTNSADHSATIGNITIKGGSVTANGGEVGNGIGKGNNQSNCTIVGTITITTGIDRVEASSISEEIVYMHGETVLETVEQKAEYFTINGSTITLKEYSITYNLNEGTNATGNLATYTVNTETFTLADPSRDGYTFAGWFSDAEFNTPATTTITKGTTGEKTFWAKWTRPITSEGITVNIPSVEWTGSELTPVITVKDGETTLTEVTDYTVTAPSGTIQDAGDYTYTISGTGNYTGSTTATFTINRKAVTITADSDSKEYDGTALTKSTFTTTDLEAGDTHAFTVAMTTESTITNVGSTANVIATVDGVAVTAGTPTAVGNYMVTTANGTLTINKKTVSTDGAIEVTQDENGYYATFSGSPDDAVSITEPITVKGVTLERSFANGKYATLMLPFSLNANSQTGQTLTGANIYQFVGVEKKNGQWIATMQTPTTPLQANTPYLVEPVTSGLTTDGYLTFGLNGGTVTLQTTASAEGSTNSDWQFVGTYTRLTYKADGSANLTGNIYGFASKDKTVDGVDVTAGEFVKAKDGAAVPPLRCYLTYKNGDEFTGAPARGMTRSAEEELPQSIIVRLVGANGETTNVMTIDTRTGEISTDGWYSIDGVKLSGKPTTKGLYINNGRKVVIK